MKPEIKFNVFVDKDLEMPVAANLETLLAFAATMEHISMLQQYCFVYRVLMEYEKYLNPGVRAGIHDSLTKCINGWHIDRSQEDCLRAAIERASRVRFVVQTCPPKIVKVDACFFTRGDKRCILGLAQVWSMQDGQVFNGQLYMDKSHTRA